jgi:hypothetical protein
MWLNSPWPPWQNASRVSRVATSPYPVCASGKAGADPATVVGRIAETEPEKASFALLERREPRPRMTEQEIRAVFDKLADVVCVLSEAAPNDKSEISCQLDLKLTYQPGEKNRGKRRSNLLPVGFSKVSEDRLHQKANTHRS